MSRPDDDHDDHPSSIGRFEIQRQLGEGGMGAVYLAIDPTLGRQVALKVLRSAGGDDAAARRLLREAQATARLSHRHVVVVHEVGTHDDRVYVAMEYVAGTTLQTWQVDRGWRELLAMYRRAGEGLQAAHDAGLVHRDFKPDNVLIGDDGRVRVTDFGVAVAGTPRYMAPEQHLGEAIDARADQFGFCVALYEAWYRRPPFAGRDGDELVRHVLAGEVLPTPAPSEVPVALRDAVRRGLSRRREDRFPSMRELLAGLDAGGGGPSSRRRRWPWLAGALALALAATGVTTTRLVMHRAEHRGPRPSDRLVPGSEDGAALRPAATEGPVAPPRELAVDPAATDAVTLRRFIEAWRQLDAPPALQVADSEAVGGGCAVAHQLEGLGVDGARIELVHTLRAGVMVRWNPVADYRGPAIPACKPVTADLLTEATAAATRGQWGPALTLAAQVAGARDIDSATRLKAITIAGLAACYTKNEAEARTYFARSLPPRQRLLRQACLKQGIELEAR